MTDKGIIASILGLCVVVSAVGVVYTKHLTRSMFIEKRALQSQINELEADWGRLALEQSTWSAHGRIEGYANKKLNMEIPDIATIKMVKP